MPMTDRGQRRQRGDIGSGMETDVKIGLIIEVVPRREPDAHGAAGCDRDQGVEIEVVGPGADRRSLQISFKDVQAAGAERRIGVRIPDRELAQEVRKLGTA